MNHFWITMSLLIWTTKNFEKRNICFDLWFWLIVVGDEEYPDDEPLQEEGGLPDWAIAVVVIGLGSFAFVLVFGITVVSWFNGFVET